MLTQFPGKMSELIDKMNEPGFWRCSICTFYNAESSSSCGICGALQSSSINLDVDCENDVQRRNKGSEASIMAKSLFTPLTSRMPKAAISFDGLQPSGNEKGSMQASLADFHQSFVTPNNSQSVNLVPFKFDTPSPDDIVSSGIKQSRHSSKVDLMPSAKASSSKTGKKEMITPMPENKMDSPSALSFESSHCNEDESNSAIENENAAQRLAECIHDMKLDKNSRQKKIGKSNPSSQYKLEKWMLDQGEGKQDQLNLAIVGHVDSGKSTLCGRLLHLLGRISKKQMHKNEKESKEKGKGSLAYAWAMDESADERERGITMAVAVAYFESRNYRVVLLDSPGHRDFVPNMISGATQADAAVLVVDASPGSFEAGLGVNGVGQTKEHAHLIRSFGVERMVVAVNKMDSVDFSKERFESIKLQLGIFLRSCGYKESSITWIPISAMGNQNLVATPSDSHLLSWYHGYCLLDAIDSLPPPPRDVSKPLLLPICDVITSHTLGQVAVCGKLETGAIRIGSKVLVMPSGDIATVKIIERDSCNCSSAWAGDNVVVGLQGIDAGCVLPGGILCHPDFAVPVAYNLELKVLVLDIATPILVGFQIELHIHHAKVSGTVVKIISSLDQKTGKVLKKAPRILKARQSAVIEVKLDGAVCVEEFSVCRALGRVFLRASGNTIAVGIVTSILKDS